MKSFINQFWALTPDTKPNVGNTTINMSAHSPGAHIETVKGRKTSNHRYVKVSGNERKKTVLREYDHRIPQDCQIPFKPPKHTGPWKESS